MVHLDKLPDEILLPILRASREPSIPPHRPRPDNTALLQVCLASKRFLGCAQCVLYSEFWCDDGPKTWQIRALLRTIITRPDLAEHMRTVSLNSWRAWNRVGDEWEEFGYFATRDYTMAQNRSDRELFKSAIRSLALSDKRFWRHAVRTNIDEVFVALLLLLLPKLLKLEISCPPTFYVLEKALDHAAMLRPANGKILGLQRLEDLRFCVRGNTSRGYVTDLALFLRLPALTSIENLERISSWPERRRLQLPGGLAIKRLALGCSSILTLTLIEIFQAIDSLEILNYSHCECFHPSLEALNTWQFIEALKGAAAHSLKELELSADSFTQTLGSLHDFRHLQRLRTNTQLLIGDCPHSGPEELVGILPRSIENLTLLNLHGRCHSDCGGAFGQLTRLVQGRVGNQPRLRCIEAWFPFIEKIHPPLSEIQCHSDLVKASKVAGVTLEGFGCVEEIA